MTVYVVVTKSSRYYQGVFTTRTRAEEYIEECEAGSKWEVLEEEAG